LLGLLPVGAAVLWLSVVNYVFVGLQPTLLDSPVPAGLPDLHASTCAGCHPQQHAEWKGSMMAQAMTDPVFLVDYEEQGKPPICLRCHAPLQQQRPTEVVGLLHFRPMIPVGWTNTEFDPQLQHEGVTCAGCHLADGAMVGPLDTDRAPHPTRQGEVDCARCHQLPAPPLSFKLDRPLSDTIGEHERWEGTERCVDCHPAHRFAGAWDDETVRGSVQIIDIAHIEAGVRVRIRNRAGHNVPTGDPSRALVVRGGGEEVVLARRIPLPRLVDEGDTSLLPGETRDVLLPADTDEVEVVFQRLRFAPHLGVDIPAHRLEVTVAKGAP
jgi:hypothetical protein